MSITNSATAPIIADEPEELDTLDSFGILIPIEMPSGNYGQAQAAFEELAIKINAFVASLHIGQALPAEYIAF